MDVDLVIKHKIFSIGFCIFGAVCGLCLFLVIIIHLRNKRFLEGSYGVIFVSILAEFYLSFHFFFNGLNSAAFGGSISKATVVCMIDTSLALIAISFLSFYNAVTYYCLIRNIFEQNNLKLISKDDDFFDQNDLKKQISWFYKKLHIFSIIGSLIVCVFVISTRSYKDILFTDCSISSNSGWPKYFYGLLFLILFILGFYYLIRSLFGKHKYVTYTFRNIRFYILITNICWLPSFLTIMLSNDGVNINTKNTLIIISSASSLLCISFIAYSRLTNSYISDYIKKGDTKNKFINALMIFFCLDDINLHIKKEEESMSMHSSFTEEKEDIM